MKGMTILATMALLSMASSGTAKDLLITGPDGVAAYPLKDILEIEFKSESISVLTNDSEIDFPYADIIMMSFGDGMSRIEEVTPNHDGNITRKENNLSCFPESQIRIYNLTGTLVLSGIGTVDISQLPDGIFMAVSHDGTLKFRK